MDGAGAEGVAGEREEDSLAETLQQASPETMVACVGTQVEIRTQEIGGIRWHILTRMTFRNRS